MLKILGISSDVGPDGSLIYRCEFSCPMYFKTKEEMIKHECAEHKDRLACDTCGKVAQSLSGKYACARTHRARRPKERKTHVCPKCGELLETQTLHI